ncbi:hypothetical protein [Bradyrhizobium sp. DASA03007]|uniref:hypothetical protein n=1 Tax=unclassified Bradyrhizobium TaxID=2631580 RepID=UPI003F71FBAD
MKRIASRAPQLDIFGQRLIEREAGCWIITEEGRKSLETLEQLDRSAMRGQVEREIAQEPEDEQPPLVSSQPRTSARRKRSPASD